MLNSNNELKITDQASFVEKVKENFGQVFQLRDILSADEDEATEDAVKSCTRAVDAIQEFLRLLRIPFAQLKYSVFVSPLLQALGENYEGSGGPPSQYEYLQSLLQWEDSERFRKHFTESPPWISLRSTCLLPYFSSKIILDDDSHLIRSASLGHREILRSHYKTLNRHLSQEITRPRMSWESTAGLIHTTCRSFLELTQKWEILFQGDDGPQAQNIQTWRVQLENLVEKEVGILDAADMAQLGCIVVQASCCIMEATTYLPVVDPSVESEIQAKYLSDEVLWQCTDGQFFYVMMYRIPHDRGKAICIPLDIHMKFACLPQIEYFSSWADAQRLFSLYTTGHDICPTNGNKTDLGHVHPYVHEVFRLLKTSAGRLNEAKKRIAARPDPAQYEALRHEALQFVRTMASKSKINELTGRVQDLFSKRRKNSDSKVGNDATAGPEITENEINAVLIPCSSWLESCSNFIHKQLKRYWYWDIALPYLHAATQVRTRSSSAQ